MCSFTVAPEAEDDVYQIWRYLLREAGMETANRIEGEILEAFADLAGTPAKGPAIRSDEAESPVLHPVPIHGGLPCRQSSLNRRGAAWQAQCEADFESAVVKQRLDEVVSRGGARISGFLTSDAGENQFRVTFSVATSARA